MRKRSPRYDEAYHHASVLIGISPIRTEESNDPTSPVASAATSTDTPTATTWNQNERTLRTPCPVPYPTYPLISAKQITAQ